MKKKRPLERRIYEFEARVMPDESDNGLRTITGTPIVYNSRTDLGYFDEVIEQGALDQADLTDVRFLVNHDLKMIPLARSRRNNPNSTLRLTPNFEGMEMETDVDVANNVSARELVSALDRGDVSGMSFMFSVRDEEWDDLDTDHPLRRIKAIDSIVEISAVTFPAYDATEIQARTKEALENARRTLENVKEKRIEEKSLENDKKLALEKAKFEFLAK